MLKPALLYKDALTKKHIEQWYKPETHFYSGTANSDITFDNDNENRRQFASVDKNGDVIGYIDYCVDWCARSAYCFGIISYDKGNLEFVKDLYRTAYHILCVDKFNRMEWRGITDNPAVNGYKKFIKRIGGNIVGELHQTCAFPDGTLHDSYIFEILQNEADCSTLKKIVDRFGGE